MELDYPIGAEENEDDGKNFWQKLDKSLVITAIILSVGGCVLIYSIVQNNLIPYVKINYFWTQVIATGLGLIAMLFVAAVDYKKLARWWPILVPISIILVLLTFTSLGIKVEGADDRGWINLGFMQFQPSEFMKLVFLLTFSLHLSKDEENMNKPLHMLLILLHALIPVGLVLLQGDDGTALVFLFMFVCMLLASRISWKYVLIAIILIPIIAIVAWEFLLGDTQKSRILILFHPGSDPENLEYQQNLGLSALAAGGLTGKGLHASDYVVVPELYNDFIFCYLGEVWGYVGCFVCLLLLGYLCFRILFDSHKAKDTQGLVLCSGAFGMFFIHCVCNIGMVLKVMPVIGVPLPFLSAGGTAVVSMYIALGLVVSTYTHNKKKYRVFYDAE